LIAGFWISLVPLNAQFRVQESGTKSDLNSVWFLDQNVGFVAGFDGVLLRTINGGRIWEQIPTGISERINGVFFHSQDTGFITGENGIFQRTVDAGLNWEKLSDDRGIDFTAIQFINNTGFVIGHGIKGAVFGKSTDKGISWDFKFINENHTGGVGGYGDDMDDIYLMNISFLDENMGVLGGFKYNFTHGKSPFICKTTNGGRTFEDISPFDKGVAFYEGKEVVDIDYVTEHDAFAVLNNASGTEFLHLSDYHVESFETIDKITNLNTRGLYYNSAFLGRYIGYFSGIINGTSQIVKTIDQGDSFMYLNPPTEKSLYASCFPNHYTGYFVGEDGVILKLLDRDNVVLSSENKFDESYEPPFSIAVPKTNKRKTQIHLYNVDVEFEKLIGVALYDHNGVEVDIKNTRVKVYSDEIRLKIKTDELNNNTYFYNIKYRNASIVNGKILLGSYAHNLDY